MQKFLSQIYFCPVYKVLQFILYCKMGLLNNKISEDNIIKMPQLDYTPDPGGMGSVFFSKMSSYGNTIAQIDGLTGHKDTYNSFLQRSIRTAITMRSKGITSNDIITICSFNNLNSSIPLIASLFLGAKVANLDPTISLNDTTHLLKQICPKIIFVGPEAVKLIEDALRETGINALMVVFGKSEIHLEFSDFLKESDGEANFKPVEVENLKDTAVIFFSSGTTGLPKGVCLNHFSLLSQGFRMGKLFKTDVFLAFSSPYWISSVLFTAACILYKGCRVISPRFNSNTVWNLISNYKVTSMFLSPTELLMTYKTGRPKGIDTTHLQGLLTGGSPISADQIDEVKKVFPGTNIILGYGQTETSGICTFFQPNMEEDVVLMKKNSGSSGRAVSGFWYKVVDPETEETLGPNQSGELRIKTNLQMNGYYNLDSSTAWDAEGWLKTGDIVYYDEDHCFFIVDRIKEMLKYRSWHVPPALIEGVLLTHPHIAAAVVVGLPHLEDGDHPMGIVVLKNGVNGVNEKKIEQYVAERVDERQKLRGGVKIVDCIPVTPSGKIKRREVRELIMKGFA